MSETAFILTLASDPLPGIIAAVTTAIADLGGNITETHQHWDRPTNRFFLRIAFLGPDRHSTVGIYSPIHAWARQILRRRTEVELT